MKCSPPCSTFILLTWLLLGLLTTQTSAQQPCPDLSSSGNFGPFDYLSAEARTPDWSGKTPLQIVENVHFTSKVESLRGGINSTTPLDDLKYTLKIFPNHHRALFALSRYQRSDHPETVKLRRNKVTECYMERALIFRPRDPMVHLVYGIHQHSNDRLDNAMALYQTAIKLSPKAADAHYNLGLLYFDLGQYDKARDAAKTAYGLGYALPGLRNMLKDIDQWN